MDWIELAQDRQFAGDCERGDEPSSSIILKKKTSIQLSVWRRGEVYTGFLWGNLREREHFGDPGVDGRIILT